LKKLNFKKILSYKRI